MKYDSPTAAGWCQQMDSFQVLERTMSSRAPHSPTHAFEFEFIFMYYETRVIFIKDQRWKLLGAEKQNNSKRWLKIAQPELNNAWGEQKGER
jgi:hypothetical protein